MVSTPKSPNSTEYNAVVQDLLKQIEGKEAENTQGQPENSGKIPQFRRWNDDLEEVSHQEIQEQAERMLSLPLKNDNYGLSTGSYETVRDEVIAIATHDFYESIAHGIHAAYNSWTMEDFEELFRILVEEGRESAIPDFKALKKDNEEKLRSSDFDFSQDGYILTAEDPAPAYVEDRIPKLAKQLLDNPTLWSELSEWINASPNTDYTELRSRIAEAIKEEALKREAQNTRQSISEAI